MRTPAATSSKGTSMPPNDPRKGLKMYPMAGLSLRLPHVPDMAADGNLPSNVFPDCLLGHDGDEGPDAAMVEAAAALRTMPSAPIDFPLIGAVTGGVEEVIMSSLRDVKVANKELSAKATEQGRAIELLEATIHYLAERGRDGQSTEDEAERLLGRQRVAVAEETARNAVEAAEGLRAEVAVLKAELASAKAAAAAPTTLVVASGLAEISLAPAGVFTNPPTPEAEIVMAAAAAKTAGVDAAAAAIRSIGGSITGLSAKPVSPLMVTEMVAEAKTSDPAGARTTVTPSAPRPGRAPEPVASALAVSSPCRSATSKASKRTPILTTASPLLSTRVPVRNRGHTLGDENPSSLGGEMNAGSRRLPHARRPLTPLRNAAACNGGKTSCGPVSVCETSKVANKPSPPRTGANDAAALWVKPVIIRGSDMEARKHLASYRERASGQAGVGGKAESAAGGGVAQAVRNLPLAPAAAAAAVVARGARFTSRAAAAAAGKVPSARATRFPTSRKLVARSKADAGTRGSFMNFG
ncbi:unnamed protein product [Pylaiella littoralis]